ncbi:MAG: lipoate--protein ligase [Clostridiaceae bacterium]|nr:lipoate--protein ligase [Clostridiaceae bacterium]
MPQAIIVRSNSNDPWHNLALEDYLMHNMPDESSAVLYLWQNQNTVVIGRNQNAWAECKTAQLEDEGGKLARRTTGGGAVFHDLGNLNFSIILPERKFRLDDTFGIVLSAVLTAGIEAERSGRNDILTAGAKFSGNAFRTDRGFGLHHGTLLVNSDYARVGRYLTVANSKLAAKGVQSVRSRVINLTDVKPDVTVAQLEQTMEQAFADYIESTAEPGQEWEYRHVVDSDFADAPGFSDLEQHFASWDWRYGESIRFDTEIETRFEWGIVRLGLLIKNGLISSARIYSDALDSDFISALSGQFENIKFHSRELADSIRKFPETGGGFVTTRSKMLSDIASWIEEQGW